MSAPGQFDPSRGQASQKGGCAVLIIVLALLGTMSLCCGVLGVAGFVLSLRMGKQEGPKWQPPAFIQPPPTVFASPVNDWLADRLLSPVYVTALDAVVMNPDVIEALGDSIAPPSGGEEGASLYRRVGMGDLNPAGETIEFDIKGPKGAAVVSVLATGPDNVAGPPGGYVEYHVTKIKVKLEGGSEIDVPAPSDQPAVKPIR
jgi:hypothetical protein